MGDNRVQWIKDFGIILLTLNIFWNDVDVWFKVDRILIIIQEPKDLFDSVTIRSEISKLLIFFGTGSSETKARCTC